MTMLIVRSSDSNPMFNQASTLCVVSGFLLVNVRALARHLEVCASCGSA